MNQCNILFIFTHIDNIAFFQMVIRCMKSYHVTFENEEDVQKNGSNIKMELERQERSQRDALDDLTLKNIKTVLLKLLNQTGLGQSAHEFKTT